MDTKEFYHSIGAKYDEVLRRLISEKLVKKYLGRMLDDESFRLLEQKMKERDYPEAFRAAHTLKGLSMNLELVPLIESSSALTEELRSDPDAERAEELFEHVRKDYQMVIEGIKNTLQG